MRGWSSRVDDLAVHVEVGPVDRHHPGPRPDLAADGHRPAEAQCQLRGHQRLPAGVGWEAELRRHAHDFVEHGRLDPPVQDPLHAGEVGGRPHARLHPAVGDDPEAEAEAGLVGLAAPEAVLHALPVDGERLPGFNHRLGP